MMKHIHTCIAAVIMAAGIATSGIYFPSNAQAADAPIYTGFLSNVAIQGYDPVSYFTPGKPVKGSDKFKAIYQGAEFHFSNQENLDKFLQTPTAFAPQYGGYCAWAVSQGYTAKGDADQWSIVDGKLYLNYSASVKSTWEQDVTGNIASADGHWPSVLN